MAYAYTVVAFSPAVITATDLHSRDASAAAAELTLCSVRPPALGVTGAGVAFTADTGVLEMGAVGNGGTGGGVVGIGAAAAAAAAAAAGVGGGASAGVGGSGCGAGTSGDGGGFTAGASHNTQQELSSC